MKKIYALAAAMMACGSMLAAPVQSKVVMDESMRSATMSQEGQALMRAENAYFNYVEANDIELPGTQKYSYTDPTTGRTWNVRMEVSGKWTENFDVDNTHFLWYMLKVRVQLYTGSGNTYTRMSHMLIYPKIGFWKESAWASIFGAENLENLNAECAVPLTAWDRPAFVNQMKAFLEDNTGDVTKFVVPAASDRANSFQLISDNDGFAIINANTLYGTTGKPYWQNTTSMGWAQVNNSQNATGCVGQGSSLKFSNYDGETNSIDIPFMGAVVNASNTKTFIYDVKYSGEAMILGWQPYKDVEMSEMHIVYKGEKSNANDENYDDAQWGPLAQYAVYGAGQGLFWGNWDGSDASHSVPQLYYETEGTKATFFKGIVYSPAGNTDAQGIWNAKMYDSEKNPISGDFEALQGPTAWTFPMGGLVMVFSETEGLTCGVDGDNWWMKGSNYPQANDNPGTYVMSGGSKGSGMQGYSGYTTTLCMYLPHNKNIVYHYDANDITKTRNIPCTGSIDSPEGWRGDKGVTNLYGDDVTANVVTENGKIYVTVDADTMVAVYNMAGMVVKNVKAVKGQTTVIEAANGLYIVRVGNKAAKVVL